MIRTIKGRLYRYFTEKGTTRFLEILPEIIRGINATKSRVTNYRPCDVTDKIAKQIALKLFGKNVESTKKAKFAVGDTVRSRTRKAVFQRGHDIAWTDKTYKISKVIKSNPVVYKLQGGPDEDNKVLDGSYYNQELQKFDADNEQAEWRIEILQRKTVRGVKMVKVHWIGHSRAQDSWIPETDIVN